MQDPEIGFNTASGNTQLQLMMEMEIPSFLIVSIPQAVIPSCNKESKKALEELEEVSIPQAVIPSCNTAKRRFKTEVRRFQYRKR